MRFSPLPFAQEKGREWWEAPGDRVKRGAEPQGASAFDIAGDSRQGSCIELVVKRDQCCR